MMFILTLKEEVTGVFSIVDDEGDQIIPIFESEDDADRYNYHMESIDGHPAMQVVEIEEDLIVHACEERQQKYAIIGIDDFLVPPKDLE